MGFGGLFESQPIVCCYIPGALGKSPVSFMSGIYKLSLFAEEGQSFLCHQVQVQIQESSSEAGWAEGAMELP